MTRFIVSAIEHVSHRRSPDSHIPALVLLTSFGIRNTMTPRAESLVPRDCSEEIDRTTRFFVKNSKATTTTTKQKDDEDATATTTTSTITPPFATSPLRNRVVCICRIIRSAPTFGFSPEVRIPCDADGMIAATIARLRQLLPDVTTRSIEMCGLDARNYAALNLNSDLRSVECLEITDMFGLTQESLDAIASNPFIMELDIDCDRTKQRRFAGKRDAGLFNLFAFQKMLRLESLIVGSDIKLVNNPLTPDLDDSDAKFAHRWRKLDLSDSKVQSLSPLVKAGVLEELCLSDCDSLRSLDFLSGLVKIKKLDVMSTRFNDADIITLANTAAATLEELDMGNCDEVTDMSPLMQCKLLHTINAQSTAVKSETLTGFGEALPFLKDLSLYECDNIKSVSFLAGSQSLTDLDISYCTKIKTLLGLESIPTLRDLDASENTALTDVSSLNRCRVLEKLELRGCTSLATAAAGGDACIAGLGKIPTLRTLSLDDCGAGFAASVGKEFGHAESALKELRMDMPRAPVATLLRGIERAPNLESLDVSNLSKDTVPLSFLGESRSLKTITLSESKFRDPAVLAGLHKIPTLEELYLSGARVESLPLDGVFTGLLRLSWEDSKLGSSAIESIAAVCPNLEQLELTPSKENRDMILPTIAAGCKKLKEVKIWSSAIASLAGLETLPDLEELSVYDCKQVKDVSVLATAPSLTELDASDTKVTLDSVRALLQGCKTLTTLNIDDTPAMKTLKSQIKRDGGCLRDHELGLLLERADVTINSDDDDDEEEDAESSEEAEEDEEDDEEWNTDDDDDDDDEDEDEE